MFPDRNISIKLVYINEGKDRVGHGRYDVYSLPRPMTCQNASRPAAVLAHLTNLTDMTVRKCRNFCKARGSIYAALSNGTSCYCMNCHGSAYLVPTSECNVQCSGDKSAVCGGVNKWMFHKIGKMMFYK